MVNFGYLPDIEVDTKIAISELMRAKSLNNRELSKLTGIREQHISNMLSDNGGRSITDATIRKFSKAFGVPFEMVKDGTNISHVVTPFEIRKQYGDLSNEEISQLSESDRDNFYIANSHKLGYVNDDELADSARVIGVYDPDLFKPVKIVRYKVWASFVDSFDGFDFDDISDTYPVYLPDLTGPITDKHMVFEILGDSMETTLMERAKVLAELVDDGNFEYMSSGVYIIAYRNKLVTKRIIDNSILINGTLTLHSDNLIRGKITVRRDDIRYVWLVTDIIGSKVR